MRQSLFVPCETKEHLHDWVNLYLGLDLPSCNVDPQNTSNPLDMLWEMYSAARDGRDPTRTFFLFYASRDSYKSILTSVFEALSLFHLNRNSAHLASVESQAKNVQRYLEEYLKRPVLREFLTSKNKRTIEVTKYVNGGLVLSPLEYNSLPEVERGGFIERINFVQIIVASMSGTNSLHAENLLLDELDLAPEKPVQEALLIPAPSRDGKLPMILMTSSRKFGFGLVQKAIDTAAETGLIVKHWNLISVTQACPATRHLPDQPKIPIYNCEDTLTAIAEEEYLRLAEDKQEKYVKEEGYVGCLANCRLWSMCKGNLATKQLSKSPLLKSIEHTTATFRRVSLDVAKAQLLCLKPSAEGLIYPRFDRDLHMLTPQEMASALTGEEYPETFTKQQLITLMKHRETRFYAGVDWGYSHCMAVTVGAVDGNRMFVIECHEVPELELSQKIQLFDLHIKHFDPVIYPDTAYPSDIKTFKRHGYKMRDWKKSPGSVVGGIETVRSKLSPVLGQPELFFLKNDEGCELAAKRMSAYHWKVDSAGGLTDIPDEDDDDLLDALRYLVMNVFAPRNKAIIMPRAEQPLAPNVAQQRQQQQQQWRQIQEFVGFGEGADSEPQPEGPPKKKRGFVWSIG